MDYHLHALDLSKNYRRIEADLLECLEQIQVKRIFLEKGYSSLFEYIVKALGHSESTAYSFQTILRKSREVPELKQMVKAGEITLCKARRIAPAITSQNSGEWLELAKTATTREIDQKLVEKCPQLVRERITAKAPGRSELKIGISQRLEEKLKRAQDLVSQKKQRSVTLEETLEAALDQILENSSPRKKARVTKKPNRTLTTKTKKLVLNRDGHRCRQIHPSGERCQNQRFLDVHHLKPRSEGGNHELDNLLTLCSTHHHWLHDQSSR